MSKKKSKKKKPRWLNLRSGRRFGETTQKNQKFMNAKEKTLHTIVLANDLLLAPSMSRQSRKKKSEIVYI